MVDGRRLCRCSWSCCNKTVPATQMSAPESSSAWTIACLFRDEVWTVIVAAGLKERGEGSLAVAIN